VSAVLLLLNTGLASYNKEKIGYVANQAALYATSLNNVNAQTRASSVSSFVDTLFSQMGVKAANTSVQISDFAVGKWAGVKVSISTDLPTLNSSALSTMLPQQLHVSDNAVAIKAPYATQYLKGVDPIGSGQVVVPIIEAPNGILPADSLPAWSIGLNNLLKLR
jgi:hypothetical protein